MTQSSPKAPFGSVNKMCSRITPTAFSFPKGGQFKEKEQPKQAQCLYQVLSTNHLSLHSVGSHYLLLKSEDKRESKNYTNKMLNTVKRIPKCLLSFHF